MVWCGVVWCGVVWHGVVWFDVVWFGVVWCNEVDFVLSFFGVVWCDVVWCGVVWCGVARRDEERCLASKLHGVNATIIIFLFVLYCIVCSLWKVR